MLLTSPFSWWNSKMNTTAVPTGNNSRNHRLVPLLVMESFLPAFCYWCGFRLGWGSGDVFCSKPKVWLRNAESEVDCTNMLIGLVWGFCFLFLFCWGGLFCFGFWRFLGVFVCLFVWSYQNLWRKKMNCKFVTSTKGLETALCSALRESLSSQLSGRVARSALAAFHTHLAEVRIWGMCGSSQSALCISVSVYLSLPLWGQLFALYRT